MDVVLSDDTTPSEVVDNENGKFNDDYLVAFIDSSNIMKVDYNSNGSIEYVESLMDIIMLIGVRMVKKLF